MQVVYKNKNKVDSSRRTDSVGVVLYTGRISKYLKGKYIGGFKGKSTRIYSSGRIFSRFKEGIQWKR